MQKQINAEVHVLDRVMYMLEEGSVGHLAQTDTHFAQFIEQIYEQLNNKATALRKITT